MIFRNKLTSLKIFYDLNNKISFVVNMETQPVILKDQEFLNVSLNKHLPLLKQLKRRRC